MQPLNDPAPAEAEVRERLVSDKTAHNTSEHPINYIPVEEAEEVAGLEPFHLFRYLDEQTFRFNSRKDNERRPALQTRHVPDRRQAPYLQPTHRQERIAALRNDRDAGNANPVLVLVGTLKSAIMPRSKFSSAFGPSMTSRFGTELSFAGITSA